MNSLYFVFSLVCIVIGFFLKILLDKFKAPKLKFLTTSHKFQRILKLTSPYFVNGDEPTSQPKQQIWDYNLYLIKIENEQKHFLNCAAENCVAWLELDSVDEAYQLNWLEGASEVTINVGDSREVVICGRETEKGKIFIPTITPKGDLGVLSPQIGDGTSEVQGKLRITSKHGKKLETSIRIKPSDNAELEILT